MQNLKRKSVHWVWKSWKC